MAKTLFDKIWDRHVITDLGDGFVLLHIDRLLLHDLSGASALREVVDKGYAPAQPRLIYATPDHAISTTPGRTAETFPPGAPLLKCMRENTRSSASACSTSARTATASSTSSAPSWA